MFMVYMQQASAPLTFVAVVRTLSISMIVTTVQQRCPHLFHVSGCPRLFKSTYVYIHDVFAPLTYVAVVRTLSVSMINTG